MKRYILKLTLGAVAVLSLHVTSAWAASEPIMLKSGDVEIEKSQPLEVTVDLPPSPADTVGVIEFTAWYQASKWRGYNAGMNIYWDDKELIEILDRPMIFVIKDGREQSTRLYSHWTVAILDTPGSAASLTDNQYFVSPEKIDVVRFRFALPDASPGAHSVRITNALEPGVDGGTLMAQDIKIVFVPKSELLKKD
jgi:hypothetical protein